MAKQLTLGIFGFGCVGQGLYDVLNQATGLKNIRIKRFCVKDKTKKRKLEQNYFTYDKNDILSDPDINLVVELIDNADDAYLIVKEALQKGKNVVTANKKMLALHLEELVKLQHENNVSLLYEASACGSIPIIRNLEEYYDNELLNSVSGIFNGTTNYILTKTALENLDYATALKQAQDAGFAESDPTNDVEGFDALFKLIILTAHSYGIFIKPEDVFQLGITTLKPGDLVYAKEKGFRTKLVPSVFKLDDHHITLFVLPQFVGREDFLYDVNNEYNAVIVGAAFADKQYFKGKGAGGHPTGSAVLSDISANRYDYRYEYKKLELGKGINYTTDVKLRVYLSYNNEESIKNIAITDIEEKFSNANHRYVIGWVSLKDLIINKKELKENGIFIAYTGHYSSAFKQTETTQSKQLESLLA